MPNRIIREGILTSERVDSLSSWAAEVFYRRLQNVVDDFGRYYANPSLLRAACYPLKLDKVSNADIEKWLADCAGAALVSTYEADGKRYLVLHDFRQQVRAHESKYPNPPPDDELMRSRCVADEKHMHTKTETETKTEKTVLSGKPGAGRQLRADAVAVLAFLNEKTGRRYEPVEANIRPLVARFKEGFTPTVARQIVAKKCREWGTDERMEQYLRPATLFNATNFANYAGEIGGQQ